MRTEIVRTVEEEDAIIRCDFCGYELLSSENGSNNTRQYIKRCDICGRDFCERCGRRVYDSGDYPSNYFCNACHDTYIEYKPKFDEIEMEYDEKYEALYSEWTELAKQRSAESCMSH
jgi:transcription elongation factor Elf1